MTAEPGSVRSRLMTADPGSVRSQLVTADRTTFGAAS